MNKVKMIGLLGLVAVLLGSGYLYAKTSPTVQRQVANKAQNSKTVAQATSPFTLPSLTNAQVTPQPTAQPTPARVTTPQASIPAIQGISRDIIAIQQQIEGRMLACSQDGQRAQMAIDGLRQQVANLEVRRRQIGDQLQLISSATPEGRDQRTKLQNERTAIGQQQQSLRQQINQIQQGFNQERSACNRDLNVLRSQRSQAESALNRQYNQNVQIRIY